MESNVALFQFSGKNVAFFSDEFSHEDAALVISENPKAPTDLQIAAQEIRECLAALNCLKTQKHSTKKIVFEKLRKALDVAGANFTEFVSFWAVLDMNHSVYCHLSNAGKIAVLKKIVPRYLEKRHALYSTYGFSDTTLQVRSDQSAHKRNGRAGISQLKTLLLENGYREEREDIFCTEAKKCFLSVDAHKRAYDDFLKKSKIRFAWSRAHQGKLPDLIIKNGKNFWLIEHKHLKESGGGQDKQLSELVDFVGGNEKCSRLSVNYMAFLDGPLFYFLATATTGKLAKAREDIKHALRRNRRNFFLNAEGLKKFLNGEARNGSA